MPPRCTSSPADTHSYLTKELISGLLICLQTDLTYSCRVQKFKTPLTLQRPSFILWIHLFLSYFEMLHFCAPVFWLLFFCKDQTRSNNLLGRKVVEENLQPYAEAGLCMQLIHQFKATALADKSAPSNLVIVLPLPHSSALLWIFIQLFTF